jgi:hypothetical protein
MLLFNAVEVQLYTISLKCPTYRTQVLQTTINTFVPRIRAPHGGCSIYHPFEHKSCHESFSTQEAAFCCEFRVHFYPPVQLILLTSVKALSLELLTF